MKASLALLMLSLMAFIVTASCTEFQTTQLLDSFRAYASGMPFEDSPYKKMTEKPEGADWSTLTLLHDGTDSDHLYLFRVLKDGWPIYIAWWDYFDEPGYAPGDTKLITLTGLTGAAVTATAVVPSAEIGRDVADYATAFPVTRYPVSDGSVTARCSGNTPRCETPEEAIARLDRTLAAQAQDPDPGHVYYFTLTVHSNGVWVDFHMHQAGLPMRGEGAGLTRLMDAIQERINAGANIKFVTPSKLREIYQSKNP